MPLTIFWLILLAGVIFYLLKRKRTGLVCGVFSIIWLAMISFPFFPELLVKLLENRFHPLLEVSQFNPKDSVYILVLGAGSADNKNLPPNDQLSLNAMGRLSEAIRLHRVLKTSHLVKSKQKQDISDWGPSALNIEKMEYAMHEIFGLAWAKTGWRWKLFANRYVIKLLAWKNVHLQNFCRFAS